MALLGIFARPPLPGLVKTRLIADIGAEAAARVYRYCLQHALRVAARSGLQYRVFLTAHSDDELFADEIVSIQQGADLGQRMSNALREMLANDADGAIVIGSDCLDFDDRLLRQAAQALCDHELVLAPAVDGGFALIGCRQANMELFRQVRWSSAQVLEQTLDNADRLNYRVSLLETVRDIDTLPDLDQYPELVALITAS